MNISAPFIARPVATTLLTIGLTLAGAFAYTKLPVATMPQVDLPTISVTASLPGANPEVVATSVAAPLERRLGSIADVAEMTSSSTAGQANIVLQFGLDRDINGAARDVQAAINAAATDVSSGLSSNPSYRKVNPADAPILILALSSKSLSRAQLYDVASNVLQQRLSQLPGVGQVSLSGGAAPAVRVELNPSALYKYGVGPEAVRAALASANANSPKGSVERDGERWQIYTNDQVIRAADYLSLVVAYRNGNPVRLIDIAEVTDDAVDLRNAAIVQSHPAILVTISRQPGANIVEAIERIRAELPKLVAALPSDIEVVMTSDRSKTIRASLGDTKFALVAAMFLVAAVVYLFFGEWRAALIPAISVPVSIVSTFSTMYFFGFSLDVISLMALTIATGFVVDDAIVVVENVERYMGLGLPRREAALRGAGEVAFTVVSMSLSLVAVFIPLILMGGMMGRFFREFSITLAMAILVSLVVSLTTTPMLCTVLLTPKECEPPRGRRLFQWMVDAYAASLAWALRHRSVVLALLGASVFLTIYLFMAVPKGFFPEQDTGNVAASIQMDQNTSFQAMKVKLAEIAAIIRNDPAVDIVTGSTGGGSRVANSASLSISLKPLTERHVSTNVVMDRLRSKLNSIAGVRIFFRSQQDVHAGGRQGNSLYQFSLLADNSMELYEWAPKLVAALRNSGVVIDVDSDQQQNGVETRIVIDRDAMSRFGLTSGQVDSALYDAFGQRQVSTIYSDLNQYHVVMEVAPKFAQDPKALNEVYVSVAGGPVGGAASSVLPAGAVTTGKSAVAATGNAALVNARNAATNSIASSGRGTGSTAAAVSTSLEKVIPLSAIASFRRGSAPLAVNHQGLFAASTISFNLATGKSLSDAAAEFDRVIEEIHMPASIHRGMQGTARVFQSSLDSEPLLIVMALVAIYIVLGVLYESFVHPVTILSTLPSAALGALLALLAFGVEFSVIAFIGVVLLIGIVKKNAIMMIDFALQAERERGLPAYEAIVEACRLRFRPIMMTTAAAILGALPLMFGFGEGSELRRPLGVAIVGGLVVSQVLTLYTTPVLYLVFNDIKRQFGRLRDCRQGPDGRHFPKGVSSALAAISVSLTRLGVIAGKRPGIWRSS